MKSNVSEDRFIAVGENTSYRRVFTLIAEKMGKKPPSFKVAPWITEIAWRVAWLWGKLARVTPTLTKETARLTSCQFKYDPMKSIQTFDFKYRGVEETIAWVCEE